MTSLPISRTGSIQKTLESDDLFAEIISFRTETTNLKVSNKYFASMLDDSSEKNWNRIFTAASLPKPPEPKLSIHKRSDEYHYLQHQRVYKHHVTQKVIRLLENLRQDFSIVFPINESDELALDNYKGWLHTAFTCCAFLNYAPSSNVGDVALRILAKILAVDVNLGQQKILKRLYQQGDDESLRLLILAICDDATYVEFLSALSEPPANPSISVPTLKLISRSLPKKLHIPEVHHTIALWLTGACGPEFYSEAKFIMSRAEPHPVVTEWAISILGRTSDIPQAIDALVILNDALKKALDKNDEVDRICKAIEEVFNRFPESTYLRDQCFGTLSRNRRASYLFLNSNNRLLDSRWLKSYASSIRGAAQTPLNDLFYSAFKYAYNQGDPKMVDELIQARSILMNLSNAIGAQETLKTNAVHPRIKQLIQDLAKHLPEKEELLSIILEAAETNSTPEMCVFIYKLYWENLLFSWQDTLSSMALKQSALTEKISKLYCKEVSKAELDKVGYDDFVEKTPELTTLHSLAALVMLSSDEMGNRSTYSDLSLKALELLADHVGKCTELAHYVARCIPHLSFDQVPECMIVALSKLRSNREAMEFVYEWHRYHFEGNPSLWQTPLGLKLMTEEKFFDVVANGLMVKQWRPAWEAFGMDCFF